MGFDPDRVVEYRHAVFIVATYAGGSAVPGTESFFSELHEMSRDFRVEKTLLSSLSYAVFGCGNSEYPKQDFNAVARRLDRSVRLLGGRRLLPRCEGDDIDVRAPRMKLPHTNRTSHTHTGHTHTSHTHTSHMASRPCVADCCLLARRDVCAECTVRAI